MLLFVCCLFVVAVIVAAHCFILCKNENKRGRRKICDKNTVFDCLLLCKLKQGIVINLFP